LEIAFFIPADTFFRVVKLHVFRKKILDTIGDALFLWKKCRWLGILWAVRMMVFAADKPADAVLL
jgi:hypothetical protein